MVCISQPYIPDRDGWNRDRQSLYSVPRAWVLKGINLAHASRAVAAASSSYSYATDLRDQALMLAGMAIELLLKALILNDPTKRSVASGAFKGAADEKQRRRTFHSHQLVDLFELAEVQISIDQSKIARTLSSYVVWRGRYVTPNERGLEDIIPVEDSNGVVGPPLVTVSIEDAEALIQLVEKHVAVEIYAQ